MKVALFSKDEVVSFIKEGVEMALNQLDHIQHQPQKEILTPDEVAELLQTTPDALAAMRCQKKGPPYSKMGKRVYYNYNDILKYLEKHRVLTHQ